MEADPGAVTGRHRQFAVLASVAAALAMAALLLGAALAGLTATNSGLIIVTISAMFLAASLTTGWVPAVYLSILMIGLGGIFVGDQLELSRTIVLAATIATVHETARFSLDSRKPTRLGAGLLLSLDPPFGDWLMGSRPPEKPPELGRS